MTTFAAPASSSGFTPADHHQHLLVIQVESYETGIITSLGEKDAIKATIHDIDLGETYDDALIFPKVIIGALRSRIGQTVLARLGQGIAKPGQSAPWILEDATGDPAAVTKATAYIDAHNAGKYTPPATATTVRAAPSDDAALAAARALLEANGLG
jgi:hypothetical protein